jgi:hypothetical protein
MGNDEPTDMAKPKKHRSGADGKKNWEMLTLVS